MTPRVSVIEQRIEWSRGFCCDTDQKVLRAIARWYAWRADGAGIRFSVDALAEKSRIPKRTIERALWRLERDRWLQATAHQHRGPTTYRIDLDRLATEDPDAMRAVEIETSSPPPWRTNEGLVRHGGGQTSSGGQEMWPVSDEVADQRSEEEVRTIEASSSDRSATVADNERSAVDTYLAAFDGWWRATYPIHNGGAKAIVEGVDLNAAAKAFDEGFTLEQLQALAIALWAVEPGPDPHRSWIVSTDRSMRVLVHKRLFLSRVVAGVATVQQQALFGPMEVRPFSPREIEEATQIRQRHGGCYHDPGHEDWRECVRTIALHRRVS